MTARKIACARASSGPLLRRTPRATARLLCWAVRDRSRGPSLR